MLEWTGPLSAAWSVRPGRRGSLIVQRCDCFFISEGEGSCSAIMKHSGYLTGEDLWDGPVVIASDWQDTVGLFAFKNP